MGEKKGEKICPYVHVVSLLDWLTVSLCSPFYVTEKTQFTWCMEQLWPASVRETKYETSWLNKQQISQLELFSLSISLFPLLVSLTFSFVRSLSLSLSLSLWFLFLSHFFALTYSLCVYIMKEERGSICAVGDLNFHLCVQHTGIHLLMKQKEKEEQQEKKKNVPKEKRFY